MKNRCLFELLDLDRFCMPALLCTALLFALSAPIGASDATSSRNVSLRNEVQHAIDRGVAALVKVQDGAGHWSTPEQPAVTALALIAFQGQTIDGEERKAVAKGYEFLLKNVHEDGTIHGGKGLVNYNTSLGILALAAAKNEAYREEILRGRRYLVGTQIDLGEKGRVDTPFDGGVGYGSKYEHSDMGNTLAALEALYYTKHYVRDRAEGEDLNWKAAIHFLQNCQNLPAFNKQPWASDDPQNKGGFVYYPGRSMAGETNLANGRVALRSYGSISYAGLLSYIYADLEKDDPRVQAVVDWLKQNYTLEENPGMGPQGLFYYFHTMTKALSAFGMDRLAVGTDSVNWREQLALRLMNLQRRDGSWVNDNARWWEGDPALVTAYALITLEMIARGL